ncbi:GON domain protein [Dictyocaulus viviparus]|uniref:GON domain protein n=1 Tax=Dictyocaulus viviparus TaxID=29172 RepID=A0A0D8XLC3_DICVI|nr:GON domain protein [Dictyocaulus viviparus]
MSAQRVSRLPPNQRWGAAEKLWTIDFPLHIASIALSSIVPFYCFSHDIFNGVGLPATCQEIRAQNITSHSVDGNYTVLLDGFPVVVYCHRMNDTIPKSYINLNPETNFAEVYGKRLIYPHTCPFNGERNDSCQCSDDGDANAGLTRFQKIRVDLLNRKINIHGLLK